MKVFVGITDGDWFRFLSAQSGIDEVNFWQPGGQRLFGSLSPGEPFLFKLHSPDNFIVGGGFFRHASILPLSLAWETFGVKNGAPSAEDMRMRLEKYRRAPADPFADYNIGCILLGDPFFFTREEWITVPTDFSRNIVQGKGYKSESGTGQELWDRVRTVLASRGIASASEAFAVSEAEIPRAGRLAMVLLRVGQGTFRIQIADTYERRCAVTRERALPALDAAHIKPYASSGPHRIDNGLLLRRDIHGLFDRGYVSVSTDHRFEVSRRIREDFENGRDYYALHGRRIWLPPHREHYPGHEFLEYHQQRIFKG